MRSPLTFCRRLAASLAPLLAIVTLAAGEVSALHHHWPSGSREQCAVCSHGDTPAVASISPAVPSAAGIQVALCVPPPEAAPPQRAASTAHSRAPPQA